MIREESTMEFVAQSSGKETCVEAHEHNDITQGEASRKASEVNETC